MGEIKEILHEINSRFQGTEHFVRPIDKMDSIDQIIGFVMPFLPVPFTEKQALLEIASAKDRFITFLGILMKLQANIDFRIEMAKKVSEKVTKSNREAMLREQLKVIQAELNEINGTGPADGGYREKIEQSKIAG